MVQVGRNLRRFLSPSEYPSGRVAGVWACVYLAVTLLVIAGAVLDGNDPETATSTLAFVATLPLSLGVVTAHGAWMLMALAVCALVNSFVFWVVFRGSAHYPRHDRTLRVPVVARKGRLSRHATRKELGDSLHPRKHL